MVRSSCLSMRRNCSASFQIFFRGNCSTCSCSFRVSVVGLSSGSSYRTEPEKCDQQMMKIGHKDSEVRETGQIGTICASEEIMIMKNIGNDESIQI